MLCMLSVVENVRREDVWERKGMVVAYIQNLVQCQAFLLSIMCSSAQNYSHSTENAVI